MPETPIAELRAMPAAELAQRILQARQELAAMRLKAGQGALERPHEIAARRREIARMMTVLNEQPRGAGAPAAGGSSRTPAKAARSTARRTRRQPAKTR